MGQTTTRASIRDIYRAIVKLDGWVSESETVGAAVRLAGMSAGAYDVRSDIRVSGRTRRTVTLEAC